MPRTSSARFSRFASGLCLALLLPLALAAGGGACASDGAEDDGDGETTGGKRVTLSTAVALGGGSSFTNEGGWNVTLTRVIVSVGPLYYFSGEPIEGAASLGPAVAPPRAIPVDVLEGLLGIREAHAHPGHYKEGEARGEMLTPTSVELLGGAGPIAAGAGITGKVRSGRFTWATPASGPLAAELGSNVAIVEGRAELAGAVRHFRLEAAAAAVLNAAGQPQVDGCVFDAVDLAGDGVVTLTITPAVWVAGVDFTEVAEGAEGAPTVVPPGSSAANSFDRRLKAGNAFHFSFQSQ